MADPCVLRKTKGEKLAVFFAVHMWATSSWFIRIQPQYNTSKKGLENKSHQRPRGTKYYQVQTMGYQIKHDGSKKILQTVQGAYFKTVVDRFGSKKGSPMAASSTVNSLLEDCPTTQYKSDSKISIPKGSGGTNRVIDHDEISHWRYRPTYSKALRET